MSVPRIHGSDVSLRKAYDQQINIGLHPCRFLGVDAYWSLCMAINVYLVFFGHFTVKQLRLLDFRYLLGCYGLSFIPAFTFIFVSNEDRGRIYGNAIVRRKSFPVLHMLNLR